LPVLAAPIRPPAEPEPALAAPPPGVTSLISIDPGEGFGNGPSAQAAISANGRWVAFASAASDLVEGDTNGAVDVFVRDRRSGDTIRLPGLTGPVPPGGSAQDPSISADGSIVAFVYRPPTSTTTTVVVNTQPVVVAWSRETGAVEIVSIAPNGELARPSGEPSVSGDGLFVAFSSTQWVTPADDAPDLDVFVRDRIAGTTALVSVASGVEPGDGPSSAPAISRNGRFVAFHSDAGDLVPNDTNGETDVFVRDLTTGRTELVSVPVAGEANGPSEDPAISGDGQRIAFESGASNLAPGASPNPRTIYLRDRPRGTTSVVSVAADGGSLGRDSGQAAISDDGRIVAFVSAAQDVVTASGEVFLAAVVAGIVEVYARDTVSGETIRISEALNGGPAGAQSLAPVLGGDGRFVAWSSTSPNLVAGDDNQVSDVFLRDLPPVPSLTPAAIDFGVRAIGVEGPPTAAILTNEGWSPLTARSVDREGAAAADFGILFDGCTGRSLRRTESCPITVAFIPTVTGARAADLVVVHDGPRSPATTALRGGGSQAVVELDPPVGPPGIVTVVTGEGFAPNTAIALAWSRGLTPTLRPIVTDADGAFRVQVLVFHNDIPGQRDLVVRAAAGASFGELATPFFVTQAGSQPPRFIVNDPYLDRPATLVMRR
jgi:Tol biopolymer transport system component